MLLITFMSLRDFSLAGNSELKKINVNISFVILMKIKYSALSFCLDKCETQN